MEKSKEEMLVLAKRIKNNKEVSTKELVEFLMYVSKIIKKVD